MEVALRLVAGFSSSGEGMEKKIEHEVEVMASGLYT